MNAEDENDDNNTVTQILGKWWIIKKKSNANKFAYAIWSVR